MVNHMASPIDLGLLLGLAYQAFTDQLREDLRGRGFDDLGGAYGYVFRALAEEPLRLADLAARLGMTAPGAAKIVDEMEARGYLTRRPDPRDGRAKALRLAPRGRAALAAARRFHAAAERRLRETVGAREVEVARLALEALVAQAGAEAADTPLRAF
jgi:DNA-binding MarR family transcriptional regulator